MNPADEAALEDPRVLAAVREYQQLLEAGRRPDRRAFLAAHAAYAAALAECLDGLDFLHSAAPQLQSTGPHVAAADEPPELIRPEEPLGDFRIVRAIGRGGMGVVYEAVQLSLGRRVALKVLPFAATLDPKHLQRFKNEAQAAAHLNHPHIVPVHAVGCERGVHFYAMQYVEGRTLADLIADLRRQRQDKETRRQGDKETENIAQAATVTQPGDQKTGPVSLSPCLPVSLSGFFRTVAELGVQAAEALEHAHQTGVVHRDVKPANLLLDAAGKLWVTDFGLARFQAGPGLTADGDLIGTLRYMSPEQAAGHPVVDHRADVYSLGATLYELLTLQPAFDARDRADLLRRVATHDPPALRALNPAVPADLETVVLKAMAKAPEERYASARELAADLRRFLEDRPVQARRPGPLEKAAKWARRHRPLVAAAVGVLLAAVAALSAVVVLIAAEQARTREAYDLLAAEKEKTEAAYQGEARARARDDEEVRKAREVLDFLTQVSEADLADKPDAQAARRKLLEAALRYYQDFIDRHGDDPVVRDELAASQLRAATLLDQIGARADAVAAVEAAHNLLQGSGRPPWGRGPGGPPPGPSLPGLLAQKPVRDELRLTEDQVNTISKLAEKRRDFPGFGEDWLRRSAEEDKAVADLLRPEQGKRLQQIVWQLRGVHALGDREVADALQLGADQRERIRTLQDDAQKEMWNPRRGPPGAPGRNSDEFWKGVGDRVLAVLTDDQRARWKEMTGPPFEKEVRLWPPPPPPRRPGP
jgi:serine/threonine protein kinase